jgi:hypothetical protein
MFSIVKNWKEYRVYLGEFSAVVKDIAGENYKGMSADYKMTLWFEEEPSAENISAIDAAWEALTEEAEAAKFKLDADRAAAVAAAKEALLTADFADLIPAERKIWMNVALSDADRDAILAKYPQA